MERDRALARVLLDRQGRTYADEAGIRLADRPGPLYQLLVLSTLLSARIRAGVAVAAARELFAAGCRTPQGTASRSWQDLVDALGRGHYRRYDERTATMLGNAARLCLERWNGDLRRLHREAGNDPSALRRELTRFPGVGPTGADIFLREVQVAWPELRPYADRKVTDAARRLDLPSTPERLAGLAGAADFPRLVSALVRVSLGQQSIAELNRAAATR
ncbi:hypothetical protein ACN27G_11865 [Plantactinospora sp. WMMB334]|uniref:hypothetical protein n=1 Tax=Plantactinospora sp. WMMB334 TaxID=3404119 RepID=UPI003B929356